MTTLPHAYFNPPRRLPFVLPTPPEGKKLISLAINESPYGCSRQAQAAAEARFGDPNRYPDPSSADLRRAIGGQFALDPERLVCGNGSEELLDVVARMFVRAGDQIVMSHSGFFQFAVVAARLGAELLRAPERDYITDIDALLGLITTRTKLIFLAVPNNPTGVLLPVDEVIRLHQKLSPHVVLVLDLAYGEYIDKVDLDRLMRYGGSHPNIVVTRTFSKAYGLAALRVGWAVAPDWMTPGLNLIRGVGNINAIAQAAAAAAVTDQVFVDRVVAETTAERAFMARHYSRLGLHFLPGFGNFLLTRFPDEESRSAARFIDFAMLEAGIWLRPVGEPGFANWSRIGLGNRVENELLIGLLEKFLK
ncbi:aminotransferase class I/II-fold pyridoxal phosphate-dependent enzyme [Nordella sp. HKS 07]|uniref:pyridoxal phosphate-dependent aminotransferase n=1 Tax=Nordella sp. HKS 07 TaxID=2712222 RepID=UPI0013E1238E|nr:histidinol-phosphate transaminase [Nordella sp. HKS 07]QIG52022.1 aminotransferase class I/II-fold pyridoxal phosphate-dependent enzyme [Nordella sp. HKS 07]